MPPAGTFLLPDLGEGLTEAELLAWRVAAGDTVTLNQPLAEVETAKATVELPSPWSGVVASLHAEAGDVIAVGAPLVTIAVAGPAPAEAAPPEAGLPETGLPQTGPPEAGTGDGTSGNVLVGYGTKPPPVAGGRRRVITPLVPPPPAPAGTAPAGRPLASPPVRKLARQLGIDLATLPHADGVVTRAQVMRAAAPPAGQPREDQPPAGQAGTQPPARMVRLAGVRREIAAKVTLARREIPAAACRVRIDATSLWALCEELTAAGHGRFRPLTIACRAVIAALRSYPVLNSRFHPGPGEIEIRPDVQLGLAVSTSRGLLVPVIADAHLLPAAGLATEIARLTEAARSGQLPPAALTGGTFTVNNYGALGIDGGDPIINHPETGILGLGRIADRPWVAGGEIAVRKVTELVLSFDHRVCDGREAGGFLRLVADMLEDSGTLIAWL